MTSTRFALGCLGVFLAVAACGGSSGIDLFSNADAGTGGPGGGNEGGAGSSSSSSGSASSSGSSGDGGAHEGGTTSGGAHPGGDTTTLPCGDGSCAIATSVCCGQGAAFSCVAGATCPAPPGPPQEQNPGITLKCSGAANCAPGTVCCVTRTDTSVESSCAASCNGDQAQLCDPAATTTGCSPAQPCSSDNIRDWRLPRTFGTCGGKGD